MTGSAATVNIETQHSPHGASTKVAAWLDSDTWPCVKCSENFQALFSLNKHMREKHDEPKGLVR